MQRPRPSFGFFAERSGFGSLRDRRSLATVAAALALVTRSAVSSAQAQPRVTAPSAATSACNAAQRGFSAAVHAAQARLRPARSGTVSTWPFNQCLATQHGVWRLTVDDPVVRATSYGAVLAGGTVNAVFYTATGAAIRAPHELLAEHGAVATRPSGAVVGVEDLDADGAAELLLQTGPTPNRSMRALTVRNGAIEVLTLRSTINVNAVASVDHDERRELVEYVRFQPPSSCEQDSPAVRAVEALTIAAFHDGGAFRADGDQARALLRGQCPERPAVIVPHQGINNSNADEVFEEAMRRVACARVWGMSAEAIARTFPSRWPTVWSCVTPAVVTAFAASIRPPVTLAPMPRVTLAADAETHVEGIDVDDFVPEGRATDEALANVTRACRANETRVAATYAALIRQSRQSLSQDELDDFFGHYGNCFVGESRDAWVSTFVRMRWDPSASDDEPGIRGTGRVAYLGARATLFDAPTTIERLYDSSTLRQVFATYDFDNDGMSEAIVRSYSSSNESEGDSTIEIMTARGGSVHAYEPQGGVPEFERMIDYDDDGRPDLFNFRSFVLTSDDEGGAVYGLKTIAHGRNDGTFSSDDTVARDFVRAQCPAPPERLVQLEGGDIDRSVTFNAILCARFYGESSERLVHRLFADTAQLEDGDRAWLRVAAQAALWRTPFALIAPSPTAARGANRP
ncbi:MAG: hypothetical protein U0269_10095 [Polyangiales bacterium]